MVRRFLAGERGLKLDTVDRLAEALGLRLVEAARGKVRPASPARPRKTTRPGRARPTAAGVEGQADGG